MAMNSARDNVERHYEQMGPFYRVVLGDSFHVGYWHSPDDDTEPPIARDRMTDLMIERTGVARGQRVLDVGCGVGGPALRLAAQVGCAVVGVNISQPQIDQAKLAAAQRGLAGLAEFHNADAMALPFEDGAFDAAWALESIFHMPDRAAVFVEINRVLRPGGRLVLTDITVNAPMDTQQQTMMREAFQIHSFADKQHYANLLEGAGFELLELLDITANTAKTNTKVIEAVHQQRDALQDIYGEEFLTQMEQMWPIVEDIHRTKMGYILVTAQKP